MSDGLEAEKSKVKELHLVRVSMMSHNMAEGRVSVHQTEKKSSQTCNQPTLRVADYSSGHCPMAQLPIKVTGPWPTRQYPLYW